MTKCDFCSASTIENGVAKPKDEILFCNSRKCEEAIKLMTLALKSANVTISRKD